MQKTAAEKYLSLTCSIEVNLKAITFFDCRDLTLNVHKINIFFQYTYVILTN